jgi:hypothetical protein
VNTALDEGIADAAEFLSKRHRTSLQATWVAGGIFVVLGLALGSVWGVVLGGITLAVNALGIPALAAYRRIGEGSSTRDF